MATKKKTEMTENLETSNLEDFPVIIESDSLSDLYKSSDAPMRGGMTPLAAKFDEVVAESAKEAELEVTPEDKIESQKISGQTTDKIGQVVSQRTGKARKYYKNLSSRH